MIPCEKKRKELEEFFGNEITHEDYLQCIDKESPYYYMVQDIVNNEYLQYKTYKTILMLEENIANNWDKMLKLNNKKNKKNKL